MLAYRIDEEVSLRMFDEGDAEEFYNLTIHSKEHLRKWLGWLDQIESLEDITQYIRTRLKIMAEDGGYLKSFAIIYKGKIAGTIGLMPLIKGIKVVLLVIGSAKIFKVRELCPELLRLLLTMGLKN